MSNVVKFRRGKRIPFHRQKPRQRVFCLGYRYIGGDCCQSIQQVVSDKRELVSVCRSNVAVYAAETCCHSTSAASRLPLKSSREMRCLSWLK